MSAFIFVAIVVAVALLTAAWRRPRFALFMAAAIWLLFAYFEYESFIGALCPGICEDTSHLLVDFILLFSPLYIATQWAYCSYNHPNDQCSVHGFLLGANCLGILTLMLLLAEKFTIAAIAMLGTLGFLYYTVSFNSRRPRDPAYRS
jgi:hypothetical protein